MNTIYPKGAEWRRWDLQVQTILDDGYVELKDYAQDLKQSRPDDWKKFVEAVGSESKAIKYDSKEYFFTDTDDNEKTRTKNYAKVFIKFLENFNRDEVCIAITDHNYDHPYLLDSLINASKNSRVNIIGGVEINIQGVHVLALFPDVIYQKTTFSEGISAFLSKINIDSKQTNGSLTVSDSTYTDVLERIKKCNGIAIYPHCNSDNGLFQERGKTDRTHLADQFNFQEFNILQGKNKSSGDSLVAYIKTKPNELVSNYCYTTATDSRCLIDILQPDQDGNYTWIKSDPTFEGLKQILFEPDRVAIQANKPEDKAGYQVIDKIEVNHELILNNEIDINPNLNCIIGGRSTGKSVLLTAIAQKLNTERPISFTHKPDYQKFVNNISSEITVIWKDGEINNEREIEFFQQGYMYDLATNSSRLSKLIQDILRLKGKESLLDAYTAKKAELKKSLSSYVNDLFQLVEELSRKKSSLSEKGDKKGVEDEIKRLEEKLKELDSLTLSEDERRNYETNKSSIENATNSIERISKDITQVKKLNEYSLIRDDLDYELSLLSENSQTEISEFLITLKQDVNSKWSEKLTTSTKNLAAQLEKDQEKIEKCKSDPDYIKAFQAYQNSTQLKELQDLIKEQKAKLGEISIMTEEISKLESQKAKYIEKIILYHGEYYTITRALLPKLSDSQDGLDINAKSQFNNEELKDILRGSLNLQSTSSQIQANYEYKDDSHYMEWVKNLINKIVAGGLSFKGGYTNQSLASSILTECFYRISYDLIYEGDEFDHMSDGKKAFVVLKLLLDFSDKSCPILIDQPEDDLDNRAIYLDLVQYLKKKKILRQVIVATHNPNIVVGADSESVIVANQHGVKNENKSSKKFAYISGSLEHSKPIDESCKLVLESQGIREHVCLILEGGNIAFKLREKKYAIEL